MDSFHHIPVLFDEAIEQLSVEKGKKYIDATIGGGGHTGEILRLGGQVLGIDQDEDALEFVLKNQADNIENQKLKLVQGNFSDIKSIANQNGFENVSGVLFDLGVSSYQLDNAKRGFSFSKEERLDMRMNASQRLSAFEVVNTYPKNALIEIFYKYGEEHNAEKIAQAIVDIRRKHEIVTTKELAAIISSNTKSFGINPATRIFQAIRIEVNQELDSIKKGVVDALDVLGPQGRIVVISFHSLEDRIVKQLFERFEKEKKGKIVTKKPIAAGLNEVSKNRRSRSAKMRVFESI